MTNWSDVSRKDQVEVRGVEERGKLTNSLCPPIVYREVWSVQTEVRGAANLPLTQDTGGL